MGGLNTVGNILDDVGTQLNLPDSTSKRFTASFLQFPTTIFIFFKALFKIHAKPATCLSVVT